MAARRTNAALYAWRTSRERTVSRLGREDVGTYHIDNARNCFCAVQRVRHIARLCGMGNGGNARPAACEHGHWDLCTICGRRCPHGRWAGQANCGGCRAARGATEEATGALNEARRQGALQGEPAPTLQPWVAALQCVADLIMTPAEGIAGFTSREAVTVVEAEGPLGTPMLLPRRLAPGRASPHRIAQNKGHQPWRRKLSRTSPSNSFPKWWSVRQRTTC